MKRMRSRSLLALSTVPLLILGLVALSATPASAQNRRKSWEVFIYFGEYGGQRVPSVIQSGTVRTYRMDPALSETAPLTGPLLDPNTGQPACVDCRNAGQTGPGSSFIGAFDPVNGNFNSVDICFDKGVLLPVAFDPNFLDECDNDVEAVYKYNAKGIVTNGSVERNDREFLLGARGGYNITAHWEAEMDIGFSKQRLDMTKNLIPLLQASVSNPADPYFKRQASFFEFTWANSDFLALGYNPTVDTTTGIVQSVGGVQEIPNVPQHRYSKTNSADIPAVLPMPLVASEHFADVTAFVNRVFLNPTAFRNRANQINIDIFSLGLTGVYNFNTKPDSRVVPYLSGGMGRWMRQYDTPYNGEDTNYYTYGGGIRFFVNEIFAFRAEAREIIFQSNTSTITAKLPRQNLVDFAAEGARTISSGTTPASGCFRDQDPPAQQPPKECDDNYINFYNNGLINKLPNTGTGGYASVKFVTQTDDFWEARVGFDVLLGGR